MSLELNPKAVDIGWKLGHTREEKGLSRDTVAHAIHLRKHYVDALETGRFDELPGIAYARGYLKRYAEFLELNYEELIAEFDSITITTQRKFFNLPTTLERNPYPSGRMVVGGLLCATILMCVVSMTRNRPEVTVVTPYVAEAKPVEPRAIPERCLEGDLYPPCFWENTKLWYQPYQPETLIFATE